MEASMRIGSKPCAVAAATVTLGLHVNAGAAPLSSGARWLPFIEQQPREEARSVWTPFDDGSFLQTQECPQLTFTGKTPFTDQISISPDFIQPGVPTTISMTVTNTAPYAGIAEVLVYWSSETRGAPWPNGVGPLTQVVPEIGAANPQVAPIGALGSVTFQLPWTPDTSVQPGPKSNQGVLILFVQTSAVPVVGMCSGLSNPSNFDMGQSYNGAAMFLYYP
jgi:hypothetical protein